MISNTQPIETCLPAFLALDLVQPISAGETFSHYLKSHKVDGVFESDFAINGIFENNDINLTFKFNRGPSLGVAYNIYVVLIATETEVLAWYDFTAGCSDAAGSVKSIFRGSKFALPTIKGIKDNSLNLRLLIWGR